MSLRKEKNEFFIDLAYEWAMRGTCFSGGTEITTPDGIKKIKNLKNGDVIYAYGLDGHLYKDSVIDFFHKRMHSFMNNLPIEFLAASFTRLDGMKP